MPEEKKSLTEIVLMPLVIAFVGIFGTYFVTQQQQTSSDQLALAELQSSMELAESERQIKILDIFAEKITSQNEKDRILALRMLNAVDPVLAEKLSLAVSEIEETDSKVKEVAADVAKQSTKRIEELPGFGPKTYERLKDARMAQR